MREVHHVTITVFVKPEDSLQAVREALLGLVPFSLEDEKLSLEERKTAGFNEREIRILRLSLSKESHVRRFLDALLNRLTEEQKRLLWLQRESRLDENLDFFIRFDKDALLNSTLLITDSGNCVHIKLTMAAFPHRRDVALKIIDSLFGEKEYKEH
ncbi:hypothetical protein HY642_05955 [Candidatus Woesearchaeota archaeon]|nr:hypothetical protein [Candidatus Woesearchaeota archaeon]